MAIHGRGASAAAERPRLLTAPFVLSFAASLFQGLAFNLFLHFPGFLQRLGADTVQIGLITGLTAVAAIAARPPVGQLMDRRGRRGVILAGGVLNVCVVTLYLSVHAIGPWVVVVRILHGLAVAMLFAGFFTFAADLVPAARRTEGLAVFGVSGMLPISLGGLLGDALLARFDYDALFGAAALCAGVSLLLSIPLRDPAPADGVDPEPSRGFRAALLQQDLLPLWFVGTLFATALTAPFVFVKTFVLETGVGSVGLFFSAYAYTGIGLRLFLGWLPDRLGPKRALFPALAFLAVGCAAIGQAGTPLELALAGTLCGLGHGFTFPILFGILVARARDAERGAAMSIFTALFDAGVLLGGPLFGALVGAFGYPVMYGVSGVCVAAGAVLFAVWDRGRR